MKNIAAIKRNNRKIHARKFLSIGDVCLMRLCACFVPYFAFS
ncbi:Uncharacterised protein [Shigella sonnei]|nr:Uncharacterised protein [Shigella sonnei]